MTYEVKYPVNPYTKNKSNAAISIVITKEDSEMK